MTDDTTAVPTPADRIEPVDLQVEIDPGVIELSRKHLPNHHAGAFDNPRAKIVIADGAKFVKETPERYDVIISNPPYVTTLAMTFFTARRMPKRKGGGES